MIRIVFFRSFFLSFSPCQPPSQHPHTRERTPFSLIPASAPRPSASSWAAPSCTTPQTRPSGCKTPVILIIGGVCLCMSPRLGKRRRQPRSLSQLSVHMQPITTHGVKKTDLDDGVRGDDRVLERDAVLHRHVVHQHALVDLHAGPDLFSF